MEGEVADVSRQPTWPELGSEESFVGGGPAEMEEIKEEKDIEEKPEGNRLPTINEELAKIFPESAHKFLKEQPTGKRGRPRKYAKIPVQKTANRGRGRPRKVVNTELSASLPCQPKKPGKVGRPRKQIDMSADVPVKETDVKEEVTEEAEGEWTFESSIEREKLRKRPRLSYVDTYIDEDDNEEDTEEEVEGDMEAEDRNESPSEASFEESHSEFGSYDESESGFESDNPAYVKKRKQKPKKEKDFEEELPKYRILKDTQGSQAGLSRYQILKVRLLKFQATKGRGRPPNKFKIAGAKRGRGRPRKDEIQKRTLKVSLERLSDLQIDNRNPSVKGLKKQGQAYLLSQYDGPKRKRGRPRKLKPETDVGAACGNRCASPEPSCSDVKSEKFENQLTCTCEEGGSQPLLCSDTESKKEKKKKKRKRGRPRRDSISKMTNVSVSVERLDLKSLQDTQSIKINQEEESLCDRKEIEAVCERQEAEDIGIKQDIDYLGIKEETESMREEQSEADLLTSTQNYYLSQELAPRKRGRPPKDNQSKHLKEDSSTVPKRGRGRPRKIEASPHAYMSVSDSLFGICTEKKSFIKRGRGRPKGSTKLQKRFPGRPRGRPKGTKNKQLEYERLLADIEYTNTSRNQREDISIKTEDIEDTVRTESDRHCLDNVTVPDNGKSSNFEVSNLCNFEKDGKKQPVKVSSDLSNDNVAFNESYVASPPDIFNNSDTDDDNEDKLVTNQSVSHESLVETGSKTLESDLFLVTGSNTSDFDPFPFETGFQNKSDMFSHQHCPELDISGKFFKEANSLPEFKSKDFEVKNNKQNQSDKDIQEAYSKIKTSVSSLEEEKNIPNDTSLEEEKIKLSHSSLKEKKIRLKNSKIKGKKNKPSDSSFKEEKIILSDTTLEAEKIEPRDSSFEEEKTKPNDSALEGEVIKPSYSILELEVNKPSDFEFEEGLMKPSDTNLEEELINPSESSIGEEMEQSVMGSDTLFEKPMESDYFLNLGNDHSGEKMEQNFSEGVLDNTDSSEPDFIDDDYLLAF